MNYLSPEEIVAIHDEIIVATSGSLGLRESGLLEAIAAKPQASFGGQELYPDLFIKAAALYEAVCNYHVFIDGNKRTAVITLYRFLVINGYDLSATNLQLETETLLIVKQKPGLADIAIWISEHTRAIKQ